MKIGIVGSDDRAVAIGRLLTSGGHNVTFSDPSQPAKAEVAAGRTGAAVETPYRQAATREVLLLTAGSDRLERALAAIGPHPAAVAVDAVEPNGDPGEAELLAHKLDSHRVVRALVVLPQTGANVLICGDDPDAKHAVDRMFRACGCLTTDRGPLSAAAKLEPNHAVAA